MMKLSVVTATLILDFVYFHRKRDGVKIDLKIVFTDLHYSHLSYRATSPKSYLISTKFRKRTQTSIE